MKDLMHLFDELQQIPIEIFGDEMLPCRENYFRGDHIKVYEEDFLNSINIVKKKNLDLNITSILEIWNKGKNTEIKKKAFVHGDIWINNLIFNEKGRLNGVIDFGQMAIGD